MRFAPKGERGGLDIFWYDGGIKPPVPEELMAENKELAEEGMMFVGDKGKILGGFRSRKPAVDSRSENARLSSGEPLARACAASARRGGGGRAAILRAQCRLDRGLQRRPGQLRRFPAGTARSATP